MMGFWVLVMGGKVGFGERGVYAGDVGSWVGRDTGEGGRVNESGDDGKLNRC